MDQVNPRSNEFSMKFSKLHYFKVSRLLIPKMKLAALSQV